MTGAYQFLKKYGVAIGFGIGAIISALTYIIIFSSYPATEPSKAELYNSSTFDFGITSSMILIGLATLAVLVFFVVQVVQDPKGSIKLLGGLAVLVVVYFVTQAMGDGTLTSDIVSSNESLIPQGEIFKEGVSVSPDVKFSDGVIKFGYFMLGTAILSWVLGLAYGFVKQQ